MSTDRQGKIETEVYDTKQRVTGIEVELKSLGSQIGTLTSVVNNVNDKLSANAKAPWGVLASWAGVIFAIVTYHSTLTIRPIISRQDDLVETVNGLSDHLREHESSPGHDVNTEKINGIDSRLRVLEGRYDAWTFPKRDPPKS